LALGFSLLILVFIGYATVRVAPILYVLYCLDNLLYFSQIGFTSYINRIAKDGDINPCISMGITTNHLGAVLVPVLGGLLWTKSDYPIVFLLGAGVVLASLVLTVKMRKKLGVSVKSQV
jgi:predicted MFS family arabinose efflux permease